MPKSKRPDGFKAYKVTMYVAVDTSEAVEEEERDEDTPLTVEELKDYLADALVLDVDTEDCGNPVGFQSAEIIYDTLTPMPEDEVQKLYGHLWK